MSYYNSDTLLRDWAKANLKRYLDPREYQLIFDKLHSTKRSEQLTRVELGLLKIMLGDYRPERAEREQKAYAESNAVKLPEIADELNCVVSTVRRAKAHLNDLAKRSASSRQGGNGLILFHDLGVCIRATFWDAIRAREYSETQTTAQTSTHASNIGLAEEKHHSVTVERERLQKFASLSPLEQSQLLAQLDARAA